MNALLTGKAVELIREINVKLLTRLSFIIGNPSYNEEAALLAAIYLAINKD